MRFQTTILATLFIASSVFATAMPEVEDELSLSDASSAVNGTDVSVAEDGVEDFDPLELTGAPTIQDEQKRDLGDDDEEESESSIEKRATAGAKIVQCAAKLKGTRYLWGGCKAKKPFGPAKNGLDCSCLSRTCVYKGTKTTIPRVAKDQYNTKAGKCHAIKRKQAKAGDLLFWGCGSGGVHHVAIFAKPGYIWHAPKTGDHVRLAKIWTKGLCDRAVRCW